MPKLHLPCFVGELGRQTVLLSIGVVHMLIGSPTDGPEASGLRLFLMPPCFICLCVRLSRPLHSHVVIALARYRFGKLGKFKLFGGALMKSDCLEVAPISGYSVLHLPPHRSVKIEVASTSLGIRVAVRVKMQGKVWCTAVGELWVPQAVILRIICPLI